ncbi:MAG TPA: hypothetical protein VFD43_09115 [Planctomycetota bacterium]|nr:hypothetical protein [Planctomycetota bacterium]
MRLSIALILAAGLACGFAVPASAQGDAPLGFVTDGDCRYEFVNFGDLYDPPTPLVAGFSNYKAWWPSELTIGDNLRQQWFYFRTSATSPEKAFPHPDTATYTSEPGLIELGWEPGPELPFAAHLQCELRDTGDFMANFVQRLTLTNTGSEPMNVELFHYAAISVNDFFGGFFDTAVLVGPNRIRVDDHGTFYFDEYAALDADGWKVQAFNNLLQFDLLNPTPSNFNNVGLPFPEGFFTGGFQWHLTLPPGGSESVLVAISVTDVADFELHEFNWSDLGLGKSGSQGTPLLDGSGPLSPHSTNRLDLSGGNPSSAATLVVGLSLLDAPFKGGTLVPSPLLLLPLATDAAGELSLLFVMPAGLPSGASFYLQCWISDPSASASLSASNGLQGATP